MPRSELGQSEGSSRYYGLAFRRGCHQFQASTRLLFGHQIPAGWDPVPTATIDAIRRAAAQVDANAKVSPGCGG